MPMATTNNVSPTKSEDNASNSSSSSSSSNSSTSSRDTSNKDTSSKDNSSNASTPTHSSSSAANSRSNSLSNLHISSGSTANSAEHGIQFKQLVSSLDTKKPSEEKVTILHNITETWMRFKDPELVRSTLRGSKLFVALVDVLDENKSTWEMEFPTWIGDLMNCFVVYSVGDLFQISEFSALWKAYRIYVLNNCLDVLVCLARFMAFKVTKQLLAQDEELLNSLKKLSHRNAIVILLNFVLGFDTGQRKLLDDKQYFIYLLSLAENPKTFEIIANVAQHPDAKSLLPSEVLTALTKAKGLRSVDICLLLCSDDNFGSVMMGPEWVKRTIDLLSTLLAKGSASHADKNYSLFDLLLPIANLSTIESQKVVVGKEVIPLLMRLITEPLTNAGPVVRKQLPRGRQEAARALWNFAFTEANRVLISEDGGLDKLKKLQTETDDGALKKYIDGIMFLFSPPPEKPAGTIPKRHVMMSYNSGNLQTVKHISKSLKDQGYFIWMDVEQQAGTTLEAMANAVEGAEVVLKCVSQKYKDSPQNRQESEYCASKKVDVITLVVQQGYKADGWLGSSIGDKQTYDFSDENEWATKIADLTKLLGNRGKIKQTAAEKKVVKKPLSQWAFEDVSEWLKAEALDQHYELFKQHKMTGRALSELKRLSQQNQNLIQYFQQQLGMTEFGEMLSLSAAIHKL